MYWAKETSDCCQRFCFANIRRLNISIEDQTGVEVVNLRRPLNCSGCCPFFCYPHCTQKMEVTVAGTTIGEMEMLLYVPKVKGHHQYTDSAVVKN